MNLIIEVGGRVRGIYGEAIDLAALGQVRITRASHVEPNEDGRWVADLSPVGGPRLGPFDRRTEALGAEVSWLEEKWLDAPGVDSMNFLPPLMLSRDRASGARPPSGRTRPITRETLVRSAKPQ